MKLNEIQDLIKFISKSGVTRVDIEQKDFKITIQTQPKAKAMRQEVITVQAPAQVQAVAPAPAPAPVAAPSPAKVQAAEASDDSKYVTVNSPMIGTFYRSSGPDTDAFVNVGDDLKPGKVICIIEAMKLFNEIEAEISGKIVKVLVDDATPVEYDQPLFLVDPS